jgi:GntR family transcriptional regulator, rspAB operon transcriptional repressor
MPSQPTKSPTKDYGRKKLIRSLREQVADRLRRDVIAGELRPGVHLRETELAGRFGVSRGPVRDALLQLAQEGWLVLEPHCGATVASPAPEDLLPLIRAQRRLIEKFALGRFIKDITPDDLAGWDDILEKMRAACEQEDYPAIVLQDIALHLSFIERAGQPELLDLWLPLVARMRFGYAKYYHNALEIYDEHRAIVDALRRRDLKATLRALETNIKS